MSSLWCNVLQFTWLRNHTKAFSCFQSELHDESIVELQVSIWKCNYYHKWNLKNVTQNILATSLILVEWHITVFCLETIKINLEENLWHTFLDVRKHLGFLIDAAVRANIESGHVLLSSGKKHILCTFRIFWIKSYSGFVQTN